MANFIIINEMTKAIFSIVVVLAISSMTLSYTFGGVSNIRAKEVLTCFADIMIPAALQANFKITPMFVNEVQLFVTRAHKQIVNDNSAYKKCIDLIDVTRITAKCKTTNNVDCELIDKLSAVPKCPVGFSRITGSLSVDSFNCYQDCPEGYTMSGSVCIKPDSYVLNNFRSEMECAQVNNGNQCSLYHVRYFVPDCKANFYRLGSTVCIPRCPRNFEDHETFCSRPAINRDSLTATTVLLIGDLNN